MSKLYCTRHDYYLEECPECIEDAAIKAERDRYKAALELILAKTNSMDTAEIYEIAREALK